MLLRTNGVISDNVTDSTFTELANSAEPQIPDIIADERKNMETKLSIKLILQNQNQQ
ncbi:MAG: hypothetical protein J6T10_09495 [Methanobrevibacter sp.]|nr:hypothetical protein [Methanobrevibacter sp.]